MYFGGFMKAAHIYKFGGSEQIKIEDSEKPSIQDHEVLVKVYDAGVNPVDWKIREGFMVSKGKHFPLTLGQDFSGEIEKVGTSVTDFNEGDKVFGFATGAYAEFAVASTDKIALMPESADFVTAASLPTPGLTAWQLVMEKANIQNGQKILIHGAAGGVGSIAVQLAVMRNAQVFATASGDDQRYLKGLGVQTVIDYKTQRFEELAKDIDVVIDLVGGDTLFRSYQIMKSGGLALSTVGSYKESEAGNNRIRGENFFMTPKSEDLVKLAQLINEGLLKVRVGEVLPLSEAKRAQDLSQKGHVQGKVILQIM
jgi:NADPH:quinone reductase-like Zn-dependent oxidoreductase